MIKFFRKIRQKLLSENKFSKYLVYAIGEIVLVVIGILIALQINNWNEAKKNRAFEVKMLSEIEKGLKADHLNLQENFNAYATLDSTVKYFSNLTQNSATFHDSLYPRLWNLNIGRYFQFNRGPYDALKSSGIDRVSNDSIRNHLINFFDFVLPVFQTQIEHTTRRYRPNVEMLLSLREYPYMDKNNTWIVNRIPEDIFQKPEFVWLLSDIEWRANSSKNAINEFLPKIDALVQQINDEIDR
ncbi:DUF6090 family protein [Tamlana flava]|uniref:DUF6090 family protein n=1 Tax=Tamlana flava TaxID=3158572 RepID=UPI00351B5AA9